MAAFMPDIVPLIKTPSRYFERKNGILSVVLTGGVLRSFFLLAMILLICPHCKQQMVILEIYHHHRRVPLEELYEKAMSRSRGKRSSDDHFLCYNPHIKEEPYHEKEDQRATRKIYFKSPEGMTSEDIRHMSEDDLGGYGLFSK